MVFVADASLCCCFFVVVVVCFTWFTTFVAHRTEAVTGQSEHFAGTFTVQAGTTEVVT